MRMKRYIAILLISLANAFILAHAVVPHFHHDGIVCFDSNAESTCKMCHIYGEGEECCHEGTSSGAHHGHLDSCDLSQIVERDGDPSEDAISIAPSVSMDLVCICSFHCYDLVSLADIMTFSDEGYKPYIDIYNSPYVGSAFGLRAPPTLIFS